VIARYTFLVGYLPGLPGNDQSSFINSSWC
jgi:hypothetical protein